MDIWDDRRRASWSTVMTVKANEMAIAAILANGSVHGLRAAAGGWHPPGFCQSKREQAACRRPLYVKVRLLGHVIQWLCHGLG